MLSDCLIFDWYSCGVDADYSTIKDRLSSHYKSLDYDWVSVNPKNGYLYSLRLLDASGARVCQLSWGGDHVGTMTMVESSGAACHAFVSILRYEFPEHRINRIDIAVDYDEPAAWQSLYNLGRVTALECFRRPLKQEFIGEPESELSPPNPARGRTLYVGSRQSVGYLRIYEKGIKEGLSVDWVRVEYEFKPQDSLARMMYATATPAQIMTSTSLGEFVLRQLLGVRAVRPCPPGTVRSLADRERSLRAFQRQWLPFLKSELERVGGSPEELLRVLFDQTLSGALRA